MGNFDPQGAERGAGFLEGEREAVGCAVGVGIPGGIGLGGIHQLRCGKVRCEPVIAGLAGFLMRSMGSITEQVCGSRGGKATGTPKGPETGRLCKKWTSVPVRDDGGGRNPHPRQGRDCLPH